MSTTVNGADVLSLHLTMPSSGAWVADIEVDADELAAGVAIDDGDGNRFVGRVLRSSATSGRLGARVVPGKGGIAGLVKRLAARHFHGVPLRSVLADILAQTGEQLSPTAQQAVLTRQLPFWSIPGGPDSSPGAALRLLTQAVGATWRMLADGTVWVGVDSYPKAAEFEREELEPDTVLGTVTLAVDGFPLRPGVTLDGRRVLSVEHRIDGAELRTLYHHG